MASEVQVKYRSAFTAQASAAITANTFSGGAETSLDNSQGATNGNGADGAHFILAVTSGPSTAAGAVLFASASHDNSNWTAYRQVGIFNKITASTAAKYDLFVHELAKYNKFKIWAVDYGFTASLTCMPFVPEVQ